MCVCVCVRVCAYACVHACVWGGGGVGMGRWVWLQYASIRCALARFFYSDGADGAVLNDVAVNT